LFGRATLTLTPFLRRDDPIILAPSVEAKRLCREEGGQELPAGQALCLFQTMDRLSASGIRRFADEARLSSFPLREMDDPELREMVRQAIKARRLVALRQGDSAGMATGESLDRRRLVRQIERQMHGRMSYAGRQYKLVVDVDLGRVPGRNSYEVVGRDDARRVLDGVAKHVGRAGDLAALLEQASAKLTPDWRPPFSEPNGLVLLRRVPVVQASTADGELPITPSQLQQLKPHPKQDAWIKIHLVDADTGAAIGGASLSLKLPNANATSSHDTDDGGLVDLTDLPSGTFSIEGIDDDGEWELVAHEVA
jgi:hypothetical protein